MSSGFSLGIGLNGCMTNRSLSFNIIDPMDGKWWHIKGDPLNIGTWNYYTFTMDYIIDVGPSFKIYKDGYFLKDGADLYDTLNPKKGRMDKLVFGNFFTDYDHYNPSIEMDDVTIFDYSLDGSQISLLKQQ